jgi:acyl-coenzyme A thioesterase PaaI-like protein
MGESVFIADGERLTPTEHARGPWDPRALHGGAPAALLTAAFERMEPGSELRIGRLGFEFLRPIPFAPLTLSTRIVRAGRRVQELAGELTAASGVAGADVEAGQQELVCRASALRVREVPVDLPRTLTEGESNPRHEERLPPPESGKEVDFVLDGSRDAGFAASAMEMRWLGDPWALGPGRVWMRLRHPLLPGEPPTALTRLAATADFSNGVSAALPFDRFLFINADLTVHLHRAPVGEWIGLDARTLLHPGGTGLAESVLHDTNGPVGRAFQTLVVQPR